jgi:hypothetical protein
MKRWICVLLVLPYYTNSQSWNNQFVIPAHFSAYQKNQSPIIGLLDLPALQGFKKNKEISVLLENKYSLSTLSRLFISTGLPLGAGNISLNTGMQGGSLYSHFTGQVNYGLSLNKISTIGLSVGVTHFKIKNNPPEFILQTIAGIAHLINDKIVLGIHYQHNRKLVGANSNKTLIPDGISVGIGHQVSQTIFIQIELRKQAQIQVLPAINWKPNPRIEFWSGLNGSGQLAVGVYGHSKVMSTGIALSNHPHLGYSIQLQLNKSIHEKK